MKKLVIGSVFLVLGLQFSTPTFAERKGGEGNHKRYAYEPSENEGNLTRTAYCKLKSEPAPDQFMGGGGGTESNVFRITEKDDVECVLLND
jgi:hypothetical protein